MDLFAFLFRSSRRMVLGVVVPSLLSGAASAALIAAIHRALNPGTIDMRLIAAAFVVAVVLKSGTQYVAQVTLVRFAQDVILRLCRDLCDRVLAAPLTRLERLGSARLMATLNDDVAILGAAVQAVPSIATNVAVLLGCSAYLVWLSWPVFLACVAMALVGVAGYRLLMRRAHASIQAARDGRDRLFGNFRTLIEGIKELKLNRARRDQFVHDEIEETTELLRTQNVVAMKHYLVADVWGQALFFALVAMLVFAAPAFAEMSAATLSGYVFAALYMMAPMWSLLATVPTFMRGRISLAKIRELDTDLVEPAAAADAPALASDAPPHIELEGVMFSYPDGPGQEHGFVLGPIDLRLVGGELVFITGGNGCGKSTLVRVLTGLYGPSAGTVRSRGVVVDDRTRDAYRQQFSAVFADFHLFDRLFGLSTDGRGDVIRRHLEVLGMAGKVTVSGDRLSTTALSSGQRRRLALLTAYLEDRAVYVFDEWAADQDPAYKQVFYQKLLPELKARGKCVVVVTHDDRYFALGDRVLKLEAGRITEERGGGQKAAPALQRA